MLSCTRYLVLRTHKLAFRKLFYLNSRGRGHEKADCSLPGLSKMPKM